MCYAVVKDVTTIEEFIPHEILGISMEASIAEVKKAYRKLSREKHPDKNPDNPAAKAEFILITKAYTILTDPVARDNFLKFGNPDGRGNFHVSIALPKFIQQKDYHLIVLISFFVIVVMAIPGYFYYHLCAQEAKDIGGVKLDNRDIFKSLLDDSM